MNVFVLGATGYIGSVVAERLQAAGHCVIGLARSDASASALEARRIEPVRGSLESLEVLSKAAGAADAVIQAAFAQEGAEFVTATKVEHTAVRALLGALRGTNKPLIVTSGTGVLGDTGERVFEEDTPIDLSSHTVPDGPLIAIRERLAMEQEVLSAGGIRGVVLRPPNVYGRSDGKSLLAMLRAAGRSMGAVPYAVGTGNHLWSFVHVEDLADLYVLALEQSVGGELYHAGAQSGLRTHSVAEAVSCGLGLEGRTIELPLSELGEALGVPPLAYYWASNSQSSSGKAQRCLGWQPKRVDMLAELARAANAAVS